MTTRTEYTVIEQGQNRTGKVFALWKHNASGTYEVWTLCQNYQHGKIVGTWRYCERKLEEPAANRLFARKVGRRAEAA